MKDYVEMFKIIDGLHYKKPVKSRNGKHAKVTDTSVFKFNSKSAFGTKSVGDWEKLDITRAFLEQLLKK